MFSGRVLLLSAGVLSTAVALRLSLPAVAVFLFSEVPRIYGVALVWLTPPYLYFVINVIIISIAASSRFHKHATLEDGEAAAAKVPPEIRQDQEEPHPHGERAAAIVVGGGWEVVEEEVVEREGIVVPVGGYGGERDTAQGKVVVVVKEEAAALRDDGEEEFMISRSNWTPKSWESWEEVSPAASAAEKPLVSVRFAARRGVKASPEGRALGVARPKKSETLENTWKTITEGRAMPLARHLKKSDTWGADGGGAREEAAAAMTPVRKSETFKERAVAAESSPSPSPGGSGGGRSGRLRRESSLGQDELNRRVEAFINKFNEEMRLQRQESFKHYMEMINRGSH